VPRVCHNSGPEARFRRSECSLHSVRRTGRLATVTALTCGNAGSARFHRAGIARAAEHGIDRGPGPVLGVGPEAGVGVEGLGRAGVAEAGRTTVTDSPWRISRET
jgi:hypothetical protein